MDSMLLNLTEYVFNLELYIYSIHITVRLSPPSVSMFYASTMRIIYNSFLCRTSGIYSGFIHLQTRNI